MNFKMAKSIMLYNNIFLFLVINVDFKIEAYTNDLLNLVDKAVDASERCSKMKSISPFFEIGAGTNKSILSYDELDYTSDDDLRRTIIELRHKEKDPYVGLQNTLNDLLFGETLGVEDNFKIENVEDRMAMYPSMQYMRGEIFQNKTGVSLPRTEFLHRGHLYLNISNDYMQTAVNAFSILLEGSIEDVLRLPARYVLRSSRTIAMMKISREKLVATWKVVKGGLRTDEVDHATLEYYRPLFKYVNGREMSRLNLTNDRILSFLGTHPDLNRHQVGIIASAYIKRNPLWNTPKYLNLMNNLLCGIPMKFMRKIPEHVYLQLSHQLFYHIKACDPLQRRFFLAMMTRTQVLGKSNSWAARDVARLGLLLSEVEGPELSAISPEAMAGITSKVMLEMSPRNLLYLTETQISHLTEKTLNILTRKVNQFADHQKSFNSAMKLRILYNFLWLILVIKLLLVM